MARNGGRPSKFTPEAKKTILGTIAMGAPRSHAADRAGIDRSTLWGFLAKGKKEKKGEYFEFVNDDLPSPHPRCLQLVRPGST
jgi:hypothetical protein